MVMSAARLLFRGGRTLSPSIKAGFGAALVVVLGSASVMQWNSHRLMDVSISAARAQEVRTALAALLSGLRNAEARQRSFVITGDPRYVELYSAAQAAIGRQLDALRYLTSDPVRERLRATLGQRIAKRVRLLQRAIRLRSGGNFEAARRVILSGAGERAMDRVLAVMDRMERYEGEVLDERWRVVHAVGRTAIVTFLLTAVLALTSIGLLFYLVGRYVAERESRLAAEQEAHIQAERARAQAEAANRAKDHFLALVSHELRSPLAGLRMGTRLLRRGDLGEEESARVLEMIERSCVLQVRLIGDLLDLSRVGAGKLQLDWRDVDLAQVARVALDSCRAGALDKRVDVEEDFPPALGLVRGDPDRLQQIVGNLVSNAIKFTPEGGRVQVRLERVDERLRLIVRDTGEGIAAEALPHIFERFRQENSASVRRHSGLGLGLAIVRHLVDVHGGTVEAESPGKGLGATFTVTLPLKGRPLVAATEEESGPRSVAL